MTTTGGFESESERVARYLRDEIIDGRRRPGSKLVERDLAAELGVSRVPVRDALRTLVTEGLVTPRPRTWAVVRTFTPADVEDLHEIRSAIEVLAFRLAAQRWDKEGLARLRADLDRQLAAARAGDAVEARRAAADFHETVTSLAANELLGEIERLLHSRMRWLMGQHDDLLAIAAEHEELYDAIADRDVERVETLAQAHVFSSLGTAMAFLATTTG
jgi:DNA-binding GntR family transcriptional regulator